MGSSWRDQMAPKYSSSLRTPSFSSSSSSLPSSLGSSYYQGDSPLSPVTPVRYSGVPFSWERLPGIPKMLQSHKKKDSIKLLPLPPPTSKEASFNRKKSSSSSSSSSSTSTAVAESFQKDPFFTALVECSKDDEDDDGRSSSKFRSGAKITRSISDRFGFINLYTCCKRTCAVSESVVYVPRRSSRTGTAKYGLINRRSR